MLRILLIILLLPNLALAAPLSQAPLQIGGGGSGNLILLPSTAHSAMAQAANADTDYAPATIYAGYFDPDKCYGYRQPERYFQPLGPARAHLCVAAWSGNFLNWASAQALDVYRAVLTGGDRYVDGPGFTVLQKSRNLRADGAFPDRRLPAMLSGSATPFPGADLHLRIAGQDRDLLLSRSAEFPGEPQDFMSNQMLEPGSTYRLAVRVQVCVESQLERNCRLFASGYKPEGLLQEYAQRLRYSVFSTTGNEGESGRVTLQARQGFIGPELDDGTANPQAEWSADSGVLLANPQPGGVIGYLNHFDESGLRESDDSGELLYAAVRYLQNQGSHAAWAVGEGEPRAQSWGDPISHACQPNAALGLGGGGEHAAPVGARLAQLSAGDTTLNLLAATRQVAVMEGDASLEFAGLAYAAHVRDLRPDLPGRQSLSSHWLVSPREKTGAFWQVAKYGGFSVPQDYRFERSEPLPIDWWHDPARSVDGRPDNLFLLGEQQRLRAELKQAFARIAASADATSRQLSAAGTSGEVLVTSLEARRWSGDLQLWQKGSTEPLWSAARSLDELTESQLGGRTIFTAVPTASQAKDGPQVLRSAVPFAWSSLDEVQRAALGNEALLDYLRGSRRDERDALHADRQFRQRGSRLGDIDHSRPAYSWHDPQLYEALPVAQDDGKTLGESYRQFLAGAAYQQRAPLVAVGANDGMLHGFDARDGRELFAYVPAAVFGHLRELADPGYAHRYFVDASPSVGNAWVGGRWRTLLVGGTGAGGNSVFALDVTDPERMNAGSLLWEFSHPDLGYTLGRPALLALESGRFVVVFSSGAREPEGAAGALWIVDAADGRLLKRISLPGAGDLGVVTAISSTGAVTANRLYVGDSHGNLWRVDLAGEDGRESAIPASLASGPLFRAVLADGRTQAISAPIAAALDSSGAVRLLFGTGRYSRVGDNLPANPLRVESLYGLLDDGKALAGRSRLATRPSGTEGARGWYLDLPADGTRVVEQAQVRDGRFVLFNLITPGQDPCADPLRHGSLALSIEAGGEPVLPVIAVAGNQQIDQDSGVRVQPDAEGGVQLSTLDRQGRPQTRTLALPDDSGRKAWQEVR
ncbi:PilC/PilY family type IV pilus protein [Pseudomonas sp. CAN2814]|uniref:pilus assembly protein n=1 Tax=Pseudomonas sp. CAN1 TaxID=3046726 RepID=UPI002649F799|nr:PilC/PilY family type IV pilus protein [Pseudomonas sp. CAN1]MDN6855741.1 PilC/PilY family type IV pilus protein [Pseudomonas sp. CAN1]